ncbi:GNAT family N-acetyltransferase [Nocardia abscessus]|uniref:GNAT family N-acetyltransferase n=1 Tax=Nocardia abscessus TaxID=120957 RepID=A0ABS0CBQ5_9NOCA|nr:GNAT family N-acetyltransferase [Nocardia abscessus]MBF6227798.1 GNAT family N-acetyltransferase [Nocardia abscessus]
MTDVAPVLRRARPEDASAIAEIWYPGWRDAHLGNVPDTLLAVRPRDSFDTRAAERVGDTVVATVDGVVAGFVMVDEDEVDQVYVAAAHRGTGSAALLLAAAEQRVRANGHDRAWLAVVPGNTRACRFYANQGWTDQGAFTHAAPGPNGPVSVPAHRYTKPV